MNGFSQELLFRIQAHNSTSILGRIEQLPKEEHFIVEKRNLH